MEDLSISFEERLQEIEAYLQFLEAIELEAQSGPPRIGQSGALITAQQQKILYSGVFLQLYNLVEATVVRCVDSVTEAALQSGIWYAGDLTLELRKEWVRVVARTHVDTNYENRLLDALKLCEKLVDALPVSGFKLDKGGGGNWDDAAIERLVSRLGLVLRLTEPTIRNIKRKFRDDLGALGLVKKLRNSLAHGAMSFAECGENLTASELRDLTNRTAAYMREVVESFSSYITSHGFLLPARRPVSEVA